MSKNVLDLYLSKIAAGDRSCIAKFCERLADRLVYVPTAARLAASGSGSYSIDVLRFSEQDGDYVPLFTSEAAFQQWCALQGHASKQSISLLAGDLCAALGGQCSLLINPGLGMDVRLAPADVRNIASAGIAAGDDGAEGEEQAPAPPVQEEAMRAAEQSDQPTVSGVGAPQAMRATTGAAVSPSSGMFAWDASKAEEATRGARIEQGVGRPRKDTGSFARKVLLLKTEESETGVRPQEDSESRYAPAPMAVTEVPDATADQKDPAWAEPPSFDHHAPSRQASQRNWLNDAKGDAIAGHVGWQQADKRRVVGHSARSIVDLTAVGDGYDLESEDTPAAGSISTGLLFGKAAGPAQEEDGEPPKKGFLKGLFSRK